MDDEILLQKIRDVFPDISSVYALALMDEFKNNVDVIVRELLNTNGEYPKEGRWLTQEVSNVAVDIERNLKSFDEEVTDNHRIICLNWLSNKYKDLPQSFIVRQAQRFNFHLFPAAYYLETNLHVTDSDQTIFFENEDFIPRLPFPRNNMSLVVKIDDEMRWEIKAVEDFFNLVKRRNEALFSGEELCKCPHCGDSYLFEEFLSCSDGCLICEECLNKHLIQMVFSKKNVSLECISVQYCKGKGIYTDPTVKKALKYEPDVKAELDRKMMEEQRKRQAEEDRRREEEDQRRSEVAIVAFFPPPRRAQITGAKLTVLLPTDERYRFVSNHFTSTGGTGAVRAVIAVDRPQDTERFAPFARSMTRYMLWHGTPEAPVIPILNTGLFCNCRGMCFFGSTASISNGYSRKGGIQAQYYMFLTEVHGANPAGAAAASQVSPGLIIPVMGAYTVGVPGQIRIRYLVIFAP